MEGAYWVTNQWIKSIFFQATATPAALSITASILFPVRVILYPNTEVAFS